MKTKRNSCIVLGAVMIALCLSQSAAPSPEGDHFDPFMADEGPRATAFRAAREEAERLSANLFTPPEGVSVTEQRKRIVAAYEYAISLMPEAPPVPYILAEMGNLWLSQSPDPKMQLEMDVQEALARFSNLKSEYPQAYRPVLQAMQGTIICYESNGDYVSLESAVQEVLDYRIPDDATPDLVKFAERIKSYAGNARVRATTRLMGDVSLDLSGIMLPDIIDKIDEPASTIGNSRPSGKDSDGLAVKSSQSLVPSGSRAVVPLPASDTSDPSGTTSQINTRRPSGRRWLVVAIASTTLFVCTAMLVAYAKRKHGREVGIFRKDS